jgi:hypothetical protein
MRFPLRLTADLTLGLALRALRLRQNHPLILNLAVGSAINSPRSPIVWLGGPEPLELPETPGVVNALASSGRHVFLPINGPLLRQRIHEFQPSQRLHLTIRFQGDEAAHDICVGRSGAFQEAQESVRTARLSGFLLCAQLIVREPRGAAAVERLFQRLRTLNVDGFVISTASPADESLRRSVRELRGRLLNRRWAMLSSLLDSAATSVTAPVAGPATDVESKAFGHAPSRMSQKFAEQRPTQSYKESVQAP